MRITKIGELRLKMNFPFGSKLLYTFPLLISKLCITLGISSIQLCHFDMNNK